MAIASQLLEEKGWAELIFMCCRSYKQFKIGYLIVVMDLNSTYQYQSEDYTNWPMHSNPQSPPRTYNQRLQFCYHDSYHILSRELGNQIDINHFLNVRLRDMLNRQIQWSKYLQNLSETLKKLKDVNGRLTGKIYSIANILNNQERPIKKLQSVQSILSQESLIKNENSAQSRLMDLKYSGEKQKFYTEQKLKKQQMLLSGYKNQSSQKSSKKFSFKFSSPAYSQQIRRHQHNDSLVRYLPEQQKNKNNKIMPTKPQRFSSLIEAAQRSKEDSRQVINRIHPDSYRLSKPTQISSKYQNK